LYKVVLFRRITSNCNINVPSLNVDRYF